MFDSTFWAFSLRALSRLLIPTALFTALTILAIRLPQGCRVFLGIVTENIALLTFLALLFTVGVLAFTTGLILFLRGKRPTDVHKGWLLLCITSPAETAQQALALVISALSSLLLVLGSMADAVPEAGAIALFAIATYFAYSAALWFIVHPFYAHSRPLPSFLSIVSPVVIAAGVIYALAEFTEGPPSLPELCEMEVQDASPAA